MKRKVLERGFTQSLKLALGGLASVRAGIRGSSLNIRDSFRISPRLLGARASSSAGFTLIELLVVIAIIGLLAAVVLASLNSARGKGADAAIKSDLRNIISQSAIFYDVGNTFTGICADTTVIAAENHAGGAAGIAMPAGQVNVLATAGTVSTVVCHVSATGDAFAIEVPLKMNNANSWCIDSRPITEQITGGYLAGGAIQCP